MKGLLESQVLLSARVLDMRLKRQNIVASNIANANTPKYQAKRVEFEEDLQKALGLDARGKLTRTSSSHQPSVFNAKSFDATTLSNFEPRVIHGENRVDIDKEMVTMTKNSLAYNALTQVVSKSFRGLEKVITSGAR